MIKKNTLKKFCKNAIDIAISSGDFLQQVISNEKEILLSKNSLLNESPVTKYDEIAGDVISSKLREYTRIEAFTEEFDRPNKRIHCETFWWIDPIDGTGSYVQKEKFYGVSIGLVHQGKPILGVIYQPHQDRKRLYSAIKNRGSFIQSGLVKKRISSSKRTGKNLISVLGKSQDVEKIYNHLGTKIQGPFGVFTYKSCLVAEGEADIYIKTKDKKGEVKCNEWDSCAAEIIIKEAGGKMTNIYGEETTYNKLDPKFKEGIIITNGTEHEKILEFLQENYIQKF